MSARPYRAPLMMLLASKRSQITEGPVSQYNCLIVKRPPLSIPQQGLTIQGQSHRPAVPGYSAETQWWASQTRCVQRVSPRPFFSLSLSALCRLDWPLLPHARLHSYMAFYSFYLLLDSSGCASLSKS